MPMSLATLSSAPSPSTLEPPLRCGPWQAFRTSVLIACLLAFHAPAQTLLFRDAQNITADANVATTGSLLYGYHWASANQTVNGVTFTATAVNTGNVGGNLTLANWGANNNNAFTSAANPFASLSPAYKGMLVGALYNAGDVTATMQLDGLAAGRQYLAQVFVSDPRAGGTTTRVQDLFGANTKALDFNVGNADGGAGQYVNAFLTPSSTSASFTVNGNSIPQINAIQVRDVTNIGWWSGVNGSAWDAATTQNFSVDTAGTLGTFAAAKAVVPNVYFADTRTFGGAAVTQNTVNIAAGGVTGADVWFINNAVAYTVNSADSTGITGAGNVVVQGGGAVTFTGDHSYTGLTSLSGGTLALNKASGAQLYKTGAFFGTQNQNYLVVNTGGTFTTYDWNYGAAGALSELRNNYGQILINGGTLRINDSFSALRAFSVGASGGTLEVTAGNTYTKAAGTTGGENIIRFTANSTLTVGGDGNTVIADALGAYGSTGFGIAKTGAGTLSLTGANAYTGATAVNMGTLRIGAGTTGGALAAASAVSIAGGASVEYHRTDTSSVSVGNVFSGSGNLRFLGSGVSQESTYALTGNSSAFAGAIAINQARLVVDNATDVGNATGITVNTGGQVYVTGGTIARPLSITGNGWLEPLGSLGAIRMSAGTWSGGVTLAGNARVTAWSGETAGIISGIISDGAATFAVEKTGDGTLTFTGANAYDGGTTVAAGTLRLGDGTTNPTVNGNYAIASGATLRLQYNTGGSAAQTWSKFTGAGTLALTSGKSFDTGWANISFANTFTGTLVMERGRTYSLAATPNNFGLGGATKVVVRPNGQFGMWENGININSTVAFELEGTGYGEANYEVALRMANAGGTSTINGPVTLTGNATVGAGGTGVIVQGIGQSAVSSLSIGTAVLTGVMDLRGASSYTGATIINRGMVNLSAAGAITTTSGITIGSGTTLKLDNLDAANQGDRLGDAVPVTMNGGTFNFSNNGGAADYSETTGTLTVNSGVNTVTSSQAAVGQTSTLTFASLTRTAGASINFTGAGLGVDNRNRILFTSNPVLTGGFMAPWATVDNFGATYDPSLGVRMVTYTDVARRVGTKTIANAPSDNVRIVEGDAGGLSNITLAAPVTTLNSLTQSALGGASAATVDLAGQILRFGAEGSLRVMSGTGALNIGIAGAGAGTVTAGGADNTPGTLTVLHNGTSAVNVYSTLADNGSGAMSLIKDGVGTLNLMGSGPNPFTGKTTVVQGALTLARAGGTALGNELIFDNNLSPDVYTFADNQFAPGTVASFITDAGDHGRLELVGTTQTLAGIQTVGYATQRGIIQNREMSPLNYGNSTLILNGSGTYTFGGYLRNITGTLALTKSGGGTQTLSGSQITYTGPTAVNTGTLELLNASGFVSPTTVADGATLLLSNTALHGIAASATFTLNNGATLTHNGQTHNSAYITLAGAVTVSGNTTINQNSVTNTSGTNKNLFLDGGLHGSGTVTINAANAGNAVEFRNNNSSFAGLLIVNGIASTTVNAGSGIGVGGATIALQKTDITLNGTMELLNQGLGWAGAASGAFSMGALSGTGVMVGNYTGGGGTTVTLGNTNNSGAFSGVIANGTGNTVHIVKAGAGVQTLSGVNTYTGATTVSGGTLRLDFDAGETGNILTANTALNLAGGTLEIKGGAGENNTQTFNGVGGRGTLRITPNGAATVNATLGAVAITGGVINFTGSDATAAGLGTANFLTPTTTTGNDGSTRLGAHLWNGADWASTSSAGGNHVVKWTGAYADLYNGTGPGPVAIPSGAPTSELRILEATSGFANNTLGANETVNSLLMTAATTAATVDMGANRLTVGNGAGAVGAVAITSGAQSLTFGTAANQGVLTAGTTAAASQLALNNANPSSTLTVNSVVANNAAAGVVSLATVGKVTLNGVNTYTGTTAIDAGELQIGGAGQLNSGTYANTIAIGASATLNFNSSANQTLNGVISGVGALVKNGAGTLTMGNVNNTFTGGVTVNQGSLLLGSTNNGTSTIKGVVTVNAGGILNWNVANALGYNGGSITALNINGGTVGGADLTLHYYYDHGSIPINMTGGTLILGGPTTPGSANQFRNAPVTVAASGTMAQILGATASATLAIRDGTTQVFHVGDGAQPVDLLVDVVVGQNNGAGGLLKTGAGTMELRKAGLHSGVTRITGGTLLLGNASALGASTLDWNNNGGTLDMANFTAVTLGGLQGAQNFSMLNSAAAPIALSVGANNSQYTGVLSGVGSTLNKVGGGILVLGGTASNTYTGTTTVYQGGLALDKSGGARALGGELILDNALSPDVYTLRDNQFEPGTVVTFVNNTTEHGRLDLMGTTQTLAGIQMSGYNAQRGVVQNSEAIANSGTSTLVLNGSGNYLFTGYLRNATGVLGLVKEGSGTQTLAGAAINHTGTTTVTSGLLVLANTTAFASPIHNLATVELNATTGLNLSAASAALSGSGIWNKTGAGVARINGGQAITTTGQFYVLEGTLQNDNNSVNWSGNKADLHVAAGAILDLYADAIYVDVLTGSGIVQSNFGNNLGLQSGSAAFYEKLVLGTDGGSGEFTGVLRDNATGATLAAGAGRGGLELEKAGTGTQTLSGNNSYTGVTKISQGTLLLNGTHSGAGMITASAGATLGGTGSLINVTIADGGILSPGNPAGTLTIENLSLGDFTFATVNLDLGDPGDPGASDRIVVTGFFNDVGGLINVSALPGLGAPAIGTQWLVMSYPENGSIFSGNTLSLGTNTTGLNLALDTSTPGSVFLTVAIPEPGVGALFALALLLLRRRLKR